MQYLGHIYLRIDHESHPEGGAFDHMITSIYMVGRLDLFESHPEGEAFDHMVIRCYSIYMVHVGPDMRFDLNMWPN